MVTEQTSIKELIDSVAKTPELNQMMTYLFSDEDKADMIEQLAKMESIRDFQFTFSRAAVEGVLRKSSDGLTFSGTENVSKDKPSVFLANHRDIVLDSAIMQYILFASGHDTSYIIIGDNLMFTPFIADVCLLNKIFAIPRGGSKLEKYKSAIETSRKIRTIVTEMNEHLWVAQRNGRTKDGNDETQSGVLKMLNGTRKDYKQSFKELNIIPVSISYELEPCDAQKVSEVYLSNQGEYVKAPDEDYKSVMSGLVDQKGRINVTFGKSLNPIIDLIDDNADVNEVVDRVAEEIDKSIYENFKLWPNNYIAYDKLNKTDKYSSNYSEADIAKFTEHITKKKALVDLEAGVFEKMMMELYAAPVKNYESTL